MDRSSLKQNAISTESKLQVCAFKHYTEGVAWEVWIEVPHAVEANQSGNDPMACDLISESEPGGIEVCRVTGVPVAISRDRSRIEPTNYCRM